VGRREKLEQWGNRLRANRQSYHLEETGNLARKHDRQKAAKREALDGFYGKKQREAEKELAAIRERQQQKDVGRLLYRASGQAKEDRIDAMRLKLTLSDGAQRREEALETLRTLQQQDNEAMEKRHARALEYDEQRRIAEAFRAGNRINEITK
jgi:hypothetical protein